MKRTALTPESPEREMVLYPRGVLLVLCKTDPQQVPNPGVRDRMIDFQVRLDAAIHRRRRLGDQRQRGELAVEICSVPLIEAAMADASASPVSTDVFLIRVLDDQIRHLG